MPRQHRSADGLHLPRDPGGAGLAKRSYQRLGDHVRATRGTITTCRCNTGCPSCVPSPKCSQGNGPLDKAGAVLVLDALLDREPPRDRGPS